MSCLGLARAAQAAFPAPWPDAGSLSPTTGWTSYSYLGSPIRDLSGASDRSTGGTSPTQDADIYSNNGTLISTYFAYDTFNQILFVRLRLGNTPLTPTPNGGSNDDPWDNVTWSLVIDSDGDGYKEYIVRLNGDTGGPTNPIDDIEVYFENNRSQQLTAGAVRTFGTDSAVFPDQDARATVFDFGASRTIDPTLSGGGWFLDWQVPLSALSAPGEIVTPTSPISFGFGTSNSNTDPFQKDVAFNGDFTAGSSLPFPFGDVLTVSGGITQSPLVRGVTVTGCGPSTVGATVMDTLDSSGGSVITTVANVRFFYQPDSNGDRVPDSGSSPVLIGQVNSPTNPATDPSFWSIQWATQNVFNGTYVVYLVATDQQGNTTNSLTASPPSTAVFTVTCGLLKTQGTVYSDLNHNNLLDAGESGTGTTGLFVKAIPNTGGSAVAAAPVNATTGAYELGLTPGTYSLILDNNNVLTDTTPSLPVGYIGTEAQAQVRTVTVTATAGASNQNFGLYPGSKLNGNVFNDTGSGGGTANDSIRNGGEAAIAGVTVKATNSTGAVTYDTAVTDSSGNYTLFIPASAGNTAVRVTETNLPNFLSIGGAAGNTGGTYNRATDTLSFTNVVGTAYSGVNFADVPLNTFTPDNTKTAIAGSVVFYPHTFTAGSAGQVTFSTTNVANPANAGWTNTIYRDTNCNGVLDSGEVVLSAPVAVVAGGQVCIIVRENVPANTAVGAADTITVTANFTYANAAGVTSTLTRTDVTTSAASGLDLTKTVDKATARSGEVLTYVVTYKNISAENLTSFVINDAIPAFTTFVSATNGALPASLTGVTITNPAVGGTGTIKWTFTGSLAPGSTGTVSFKVTVR